MKSVKVATQVFEGQKPGTSGLRKKVKEFFAPNYTENFIQCTLDAIDRSVIQGCTLVVGGDGRYGVPEVVGKIIRMAAANGVGRLIVGQGGIFSTPAVSCIIRKNRADGGIILTASHNPGGPNADFGIKFNMENGGPAPTEFTNRIFEHSKKIKEYSIVPDLEVDINTIGSHEYEVDGKTFKVDIIDSLKDYVELMKDIFDFNLIKEYLKGSKVLINSLHGVTGPYVEKIFKDELGVDPSTSFMKTNLLSDFGGEHPDPNLTYAKDLVEAMKNGDFDFGAAFDGDGDRNMILGAKAFFVTPCDSVAVIANNLDCIPYFQKTKINGYARSMPTSGALDRVAKAKGKECFETPTGWKFFGNLLDADRICLCGEESFGTGSSHVREKDGVWAALAWLQILSSQKQSVKGVLENHWAQYGRNFFTRYDFENCKSEEGQKVMDLLHKFIEESSNLGKSFTSLDKTFVVSKMDDFSYTDPIDGSVSKNQGIRIFFEDGSRIVYRLSGTGSSGATIRIYVDAFEADKEKQLLSAKEMLAPCVQLSLKIADIEGITGRKEPTVIT